MNIIRKINELTKLILKKLLGEKVVGEFRRIEYQLIRWIEYQLNHGRMDKKSYDEFRWIENQLNTGRTDKNNYYDRLTELVIKTVLEPSSVCIDVGCHVGTILNLMMKYAPNGTFLAFEPLPHLYEKLIHDFRSKNIHIYNLALSNSEGESSFNYVISNPGYSGLIKRSYDRPQEEDTQIVVKTKQLDTVLSNEEFGRVSFIKIDVEGAEYLVIDGAQNCISRDKPVIVFEHGIGAVIAMARDQKMFLTCYPTNAAFAFH